MARTTINPQSKGWQTVTATAGALDIVFTPADVTNKNQFRTTGREILLAYNTGSTARTVTVNAPATPFGRSGSLTAYAVEPGAVAWIGRFSPDWKQTDGYVYCEASHADIRFAVIRMA